MNRDRLVLLAALAGALACWTAAARLKPRIEAQRVELQLEGCGSLEEGAPARIGMPPELNAALGIFRGLAIDYLWIRLTQLKEAGKFYEAVELSELITTLQPRFAKVWEFHAWNMAYNISVAVKTPKEKWRWVQAGISLLRDRGIPLNPRSALLYRELAHLFFNKIGKYSADAQDFYKFMHAAEWHQLLGPPPQGSAQAQLAWLSALAEAPATWAELLRQNPQAAAQLLALQAMDCELNLAGVRKLGAQDHLEVLVREGREDSAAAAKLLAWLRDPGIATERQALLNYARAKALREEYHMDPAFMAELVRTFGPLDWRHPATHALYWSLLGARRSEGWKSNDAFDVVQTDRMVLHALQELANHGAVSFDPLLGYNYAPEPLLFDAYEKALLEAGRRQGAEGQAPYELRESHRGFLMRVTMLLYFHGGRAQAEAAYARLRKFYGEKADYAMPLDTFVRAQAAEGLERVDNARPAIHTLLSQAIREGFALERPATAQGYINQARLKYDLYQEFQRKTGPLEVKVHLAPFLEMFASVLANLMLRSPEAVHPLLKQRIWNQAPLELRQWTFDRIREPLYQQAHTLGIQPEQAFPEPPGMGEFRQRQRESLAPAEKPEGEWRP